MDYSKAIKKLSILFLFLFSSIGEDNNHMDWIRVMQRFEADGMSLSQTYCYLDAFVDKPLSQEKLDWLQRDFDLMRNPSSQRTRM